MRIDVLTLFPEALEPFFASSIIGRAVQAGLVKIVCTNFRDFAIDKHRSVDDKPFGGGAGMVLMPGPIFAAVEHVEAQAAADSGATVRLSGPCSAGEEKPGETPESLAGASGMECGGSDAALDSPGVPAASGEGQDTGCHGRDVCDHGMSPSGMTTRILLTPQGQLFNQHLARQLASQERLLLVCGHYEGFDERIRTGLNPLEISIGDYVLSGGEPAAMVVIDAVVRLLPGAVGGEQTLDEESFNEGLLEYPQYTRPRDFRGMQVPEILVSGHHKNMMAWRRAQALKRTWQRRPELLKARPALLEELRQVLRDEGCSETDLPAVPEASTAGTDRTDKT